jgi:hypothetical protein
MRTETWTPIARIRDDAGVTPERMAKAPAWTTKAIDRLERELAEARAAFDALAGNVPTGPGVIEVAPDHGGQAVRFQPGASVVVHLADGERHGEPPRAYRIRLDRFGRNPEALDVMWTGSSPLAALGTGGQNVLSLVALER